MKFVPVITACEMFEETPMSFKRKITLNTGDTAIEEGVFYAPSLVTLRGDIGGYITNVLSEDANGSLYLTFTFAMPLHSTVTGSGEEIAEKKWVRDLATGTSEKSLKSILKMFDGGLLN
ncbi:hypothetical protein B0J17DRAFT_671237 [Rhizoctonia solani]|nr:hypothetical protein B0J17DRAFT_671237 [Rhizoctonia solani]